MCPKPHGRISTDCKEMGEMFCYYKESCGKEQYMQDINVFTHAHIQKQTKIKNILISEDKLFALNQIINGHSP